MKHIILYNTLTNAVMFASAGEDADIDRWVALMLQKNSTLAAKELDAATYGSVESNMHKATVRGNAVVVRDDTYKEKRTREYPPMHVQLEDLWDAMDAGQIPKATQFYDRIKAVKNKHPKPQE